ncbi:pre-rRNA processing protein Utp22 [Talaromyces stipitatus ATCC 10500]|uniref:U3 small nucleolar RNA-associated protein 22 n=1 Tax=Talaromyces stipitatus (strain ATCC 10500 / CBS 375.48 / QM 6759 / NRRL 1006) TaxID=441959 RepID=B8MNR5_TALSN|nr:pre-rRNA processing protein Utp22 [Talaromyces stipitatus ATCC 10500]EED14154.1 pre-rRNA processing protein Utp22 [Talaromyces stipitatus ATCC 10500]
MSDPSTKRRKLNGPASTHQGHDQNNSGYSSSENDDDRKVASSSKQVKQLKPQNRTDTANRFAEVGRATGLSKSSLFKLQTDELLAGLRPDYDKLVFTVQDNLRRIRDILQQVPERESKRADVAAKELRDKYHVTVPFPCHSSDDLAKYHVSFQPPISIDLVGSLCLRAGLQATETFNVDIAVTIPNTLFQPKDYRNYKYFQKRAFYIACIAASLREAKLPFSIQYSYQDGDLLRPIVVLEPTENAAENSPGQPICIRILTAVEDDLFPTARTLPSKNNVQASGAEDEAQSSEETKSSPFYNSALRFESMVIPYQKWLQNSLKKYTSMRDASLLGQTWLRQRGFASCIEKGGFGSFEWMLLLGLLFEGGGANGKPVLLPSYSSYQIFRAAIQFLAARDLMHPMSLFANDVEFPAGSPVFYDGKRGLNILYKMTIGSYKLLRHECSLTISLLNETRFDNFEKVFIFQNNDPMLKFDRLVSLSPPRQVADPLHSVYYQNHVYDILERSLGDRAKVICLWTDSTPPRALKSKSLNDTHPQQISIGLILDPENANRIVDHGPAAEMQEEAAAFRAFWGDKAELRRFRDGSILESLVWSDQGLSRHLKVPRHSIKCVGDGFDETLQQLAGPENQTAAMFQGIRDAFQSLQSSFQNMDDIPLQVRQLQPASPFLRSTAVISDPKDLGLTPVDINLQLESSAKWPDNLDAIQMTKVAFLVRIGEALKDNGDVHSFRVGLENESKLFMNRAFLDIRHTTGIQFRLRIHHEREATLLERKLKETGLSPHYKEEVGAALFEYKRTFIHSPRITQVIQTLSNRYPLLSPTVRLMKHWFNSQLLLSHVTEEFVELLAINIYVSSHPWTSPSSLMTGFYRTLTLLSKWNWQQEPLILDMGGLTAEDVKTIETRFLAWRNIDPAMKKVSMIVASNLDHDGVTWTLNEKPPKVVAGHITRLARAAVEVLKQQHGREEKTSLETLLFRPALSPYDFVIHLNDPNKKSKKHSTQQFANLKGSASLSLSSEASSRDIMVSYLYELQTIFEHCILFFYSHEENVIAGLWKPTSTTSRPMNLKTAYSTRPVHGEDSSSVEVTLNKDSILNEIARLGGSLVHNIDIKNV